MRGTRIRPIGVGFCQAIWRPGRQHRSSVNLRVTDCGGGAIKREAPPDGGASHGVLTYGIVCYSRLYGTPSAFGNRTLPIAPETTSNVMM